MSPQLRMRMCSSCRFFVIWVIKPWGICIPDGTLLMSLARIKSNAPFAHVNRQRPCYPFRKARSPMRKFIIKHGMGIGRFYSYVWKQRVEICRIYICMVFVMKWLNAINVKCSISWKWIWIRKLEQKKTERQSSEVRSATWSRSSLFGLNGQLIMVLVLSQMVLQQGHIEIGPS